jgi:alkanesulfonate monooxygenase SsuD/methylene tetrahydromethanopterin reductase-like flavin-dependent oxidoreductase (luciferase family)
MRFTYAEAMTDPSYMAPLAQAAEAAGYDSFLIPDSVAYPEESDSQYPFTEDGSREFLEDKPILEPFALVNTCLGANSLFCSSAMTSRAAQYVKIVST